MSSNKTDQLLFTKVGTGDDVDFVATLTIPTEFDSIASLQPPGEDGVRRSEIFCVPIDAGDVPVASVRGVDMLTMTLVKIVRRPLPPFDGTDVPVETGTITDAGFYQLNDIPFAGGEYTIRLTDITAPGGTNAIEVWHRAVVR